MMINCEVKGGKSIKVDVASKVGPARASIRGKSKDQSNRDREINQITKVFELLLFASTDDNKNNNLIKS